MLAWIVEHWQAVVVLTLLCLSIALYVSEFWPVELVAMGMTCVLVLLGILNPHEGLSGITNKATVTVAAMLVVSHALYITGSLNGFANFLSRCAQHSFSALFLAMMLIAGLLSAFINNTAVVAIFIPLVLGVAGDINKSPSKLLIPLSFASLFGGFCTMIGTSTNLLVASLAEQDAGLSFGLFEFAPLGLILACIGFVYLFFVGEKLLPERRTLDETEESYGSGQYVILLEYQSPQERDEGQTVAAVENETDVEILDLLRDDEHISPSPDISLRTGDWLTASGTLPAITSVMASDRLHLWKIPTQSQETIQVEKAADKVPVLAEVLVPPHSRFCDHLLSRYLECDKLHAEVIGIRNRFENTKQSLQEIALQPGDILLLKLSEEDLHELHQEADLLLLSQHDFPSYRTMPSVFAISIVVLLVVFAISGIVPIHIGAVCGALLLVFLRCITMKDFYEAIHWKVIFLLSGLLPIGIAMENSGATAMLSRLLTQHLGHWGPWAMLSILYLITVFLTELISNNATVVLLVPVAIAIAQKMGVNPKPFILAVAYGGSASVLSPIGYQTNTMVYKPGGYQFSDFARVGFPLFLLFWFTVTVLCPLLYPF